MRGAVAKKIRKTIKKNQLVMANDFKVFVNGLKFGERIKIAWRIIRRKL